MSLKKKMPFNFLELVSKTEKLQTTHKLSIAKSAITKLPALDYTTTLWVVQTQEDLKNGINDLLGGKSFKNINEQNPIVLGCDAEWKPTFEKGDYNPTSIVQLSSLSVIVIVQLGYFEKSFPSVLKELLEHPYVFKVGLGSGEDQRRLDNDFKIHCHGFLDLEIFPIVTRCPKRNLKMLVAIFCKKKIEKKKKATLSNWSAEVLTKEQIEYACDDAYCAILLYHELVKLYS